MARRCTITGKDVMAGNNVSHANNRTKRRFLPNIQMVSFLSETLNKTFKLKLATRSIRTIEHHGGFDAFLIKTPDSKLPSNIVKIKKQIKKAQLKES